MGAHPEFRADPGAVVKALMSEGAKVNAMALDDQKAALEADAPELLNVQKRERNTGLKRLKGETEKVVMRFAPNPNGPLSLGHSRGLAILNQYRSEYEGKLILRLDDTDPQVKPPLWDESRGWNGYEMIVEDYQWFTGDSPDLVVKASDRIPVYMAVAKQILEMGGAYVCTCEPEAFRDLKNSGQECPCRNLESAHHANAFQEMCDGKRVAGSCVVRIKTDIQHKDPALRDWTAWRIVADDAVHPRASAGEIPDYRCWPLLDFQSAVEDHEQGVTHVIRGKDLMDSTRKQQFLYDHMGWTYPETMYWGRVSVHGAGKFSTSQMRKGIEEGLFSGWDDVRLPTLRALRRRGFTAQGLRNFWIDLGISEKDIAASMENIEAHNSKVIDEKTPRAFFVPDAKKFQITGVDGMVAKAAVHPQKPEMGIRELTPGDSVWLPTTEVADRAVVRLKDLGNCRINGKLLEFVGEEMDRSIPIIQWAPEATAKPFIVEKDTGDFTEIDGYVEDGVAPGLVQFERFGFVNVIDSSRGVFAHQ